MTDSRTDVERLDIARIELAPPTVPSDAATLEQMLGELERSHPLDAEHLVRTLTNLCERRFAAGVDGEGERFATRAVAFAEQQLGEQHPDLVILLNDITRLCLRQQAFGAAEPFVLRLLALKRGKGDTHAEVATVLATLATIRQALGRHEAAEDLWRRVLAIREHTLAPNHFAIATALEHLGESCAARGKLRESLECLRRAQAIREVTLGAEHPSLRAVRERIADVELQREELEGEAPAASTFDSPVFAEARSRRDFPSALPPLASALAPATPPAATATSTVDADTGAATLASADTQMVVTRAPSAALAVESARVPSPTLTASEVAYAEALISVQRELDAEAVREQAAGQASAVGFWRRWRERGVLSKAALLLLLALILGPIWWRSELDGSSTDTQYTATPRPAPLSQNATSVAAAPSPLATPTPAVTDPAVAKAVVPVRVTAQAPKKELSTTVAEATAAVAIPRLATSVIARADSAIRGVKVPDRAASDAALNLVPSAGAITLPSGVRETSAPPLRARVAGVVPTPKYPETLARSGIGGEVRVRFVVDADGVPTMSSFEVVHSPHAQLSAAVREVVARTRFEPARSATDGRPLPDQVEMSFQFERPNE